METIFKETESTRFSNLYFKGFYETEDYKRLIAFYKTLTFKVNLQLVLIRTW